MKIILRLGGKKYSINSPVKSPWTRRTWCGGSTDEECDWLIRTSTPSHRPVSRDGRPLPPGLDVIGCGLACALRTASAATRSRNDKESHGWIYISLHVLDPKNARMSSDGSDSKNHRRGRARGLDFGAQKDALEGFLWLCRTNRDERAQINFAITHLKKSFAVISLKY